MWDKIRKTIALCLVGGVLYCCMEGIWRGYTHWTMFLLAAFLSLPLDQINEQMSWDTPIWLQAIFGGMGITAAELVAGLILNVWFGLRVWDYSDLPWNYMGQICPQYSVLWVLLAGFGIVLFDILRWCLFDEEKPRYFWKIK
jgi:hypothetical protein